MRFMSTSRSGSSWVPVPGCGMHENEVYPHSSESNGEMGNSCCNVNEVFALLLKSTSNSQISRASLEAPTQASSRMRMIKPGVPAAGGVVPFRLTGVAAWKPMVPKSGTVKRWAVVATPFSRSARFRA